MQFEDFELHAEPTVTNAVCRKCRNNLIEVPNGWLSRAWFCPVCEFVYVLRLAKLPAKRLDETFITQCRAVAEAKRKRLANK